MNHNVTIVRSMKMTYVGKHVASDIFDGVGSGGVGHVVALTATKASRWAGVAHT